MQKQKTRYNPGTTDNSNNETDYESTWTPKVDKLLEDINSSTNEAEKVTGKTKKKREERRGCGCF